MIPSRSFLRRLALRGLAAALAAGTLASPALAADPGKVIRYVFPAAETGFDPAGIQDLYSGTIVQAIFDTLLTYDYLARPARLVPQAAESMPQVTDNGRTYTFHIRKGIYFTPDDAFGGKKRELTAEDFAYSLKRLVDPKIASPYAWLVQGKIVGLDEAEAAAKKSGKFDYDAKLAGLETPDRYTLRIRLKQADYNLPYILAHEPTSAVAREVIEKYRDEAGRAMANPVGTGPYVLKQWIRSNKIVLEANPEFRGFTWDFRSSDPADAKLVADMKGKKMPQVGRIEVSIMEEDQARLLAFQKGELDIMNMEGPLAPNVLDGDKLKPAFAQKGVKLSRFVDPEISYVFWNMQDPVVGGLSKEKVALRRALAMAYNVDEEIRVVRNGQAVEAHYPIPPGVVGHDPAYKSLLQYDPALANRLLDRFGYKKGKDGWRTLPDGKPLVIHYVSRNEASGVLQAEVWRKTYTAIGIRMVNDRMIFSDLLRAEQFCKVQSRNYQWVADYPDGDNFMQLYYGPNVHQNNAGCVADAEFDRMYAQTQKMPAGPERDVLYHKMARRLEVIGASRMGYARYRNMLAQPKVMGYKKHPILKQEWQYIDIDPSK
jgi:ABC-type transport system substrate-binding protein